MVSFRLPRVVTRWLAVACLGSLAMIRLGAEGLLTDLTGIEEHGWLTVTGETRTRYETLDGQFRLGRSGGDQLLLLRTLLQVEARLEPVAVGVEVQDSRSYLGDSGTPISNSLVNPLDFLQLYGRISLPGILGDSSKTRLTLGRQTLSIGSKRQIERVEFANVIQNYTGAHLQGGNGRGDELHALFVVPVGRFPRTPEELLDNELEADEEQWGRKLWALHYRRAGFLPELVSDLWGELFIYGLHEEDEAGVPTPNRSHVTPGFRLYRARKPGRWDMDIEAAYRAGSRRATSLPSDTTDLDVQASMLYATVGFAFDTPLKPHLAVQYYWASGDEDPTDGNYGQYERLFGSRRTDLNNTSIYGPLTPANLNAPGVRIEVAPSKRFDARVTYSAAFLASDTDAWEIARLRDPSGQSGRFIGHAFDGRFRYWLAGDDVLLEVGGSALLHGEFSRNAPGSPNPGETYFGYTSLSVFF